ncbi:MAG TPA: hypothetical protein DCS07_07970 [Bdellovibrionales bacterium]|nr:MAG: hypothetical protein A2Z97_15345 [Bdellovibrionales bacterium GWB1_52_6]OFZ03355.1 MAG: hypothetical protein A2X97_05270 [Bdellovibrionales bacterium GWA1_52_35]OFZ34638.1 MAG: hypothetical protein A2070_05805 [Bdellovibrionales bacterium GWC1_52_8]HAR42552.1 hypothetical protein [Bdellovibrionales bacterium]HCM40938.1 hypothetical protein [Bdellovibrionales bacterium]
MKISHVLTCAAFLITAAFAEEKSVEPYIDRLKSGMEAPAEPAESPESYTESIRKGLPVTPESESSSDPENYIKKLRRNLPENAGEEKSYTERKKEELGTPAEEEGAIAKFNKGESELKPRREGEIHNAFGLKMGTSVTRNTLAQAGSSLRAFTDVYGTAWAPDLTFFYEYQPFHSEWFGNFGLMMTGGGSFHKGKGKFEFTLLNRQDADRPFATESRTTLNFFTLPVTLAVNYRFNLLRILRPFIAAGPSLIGYMETRSDTKSGHRGYSTGLWVSGGVALLLDWLSAGSTWNLYAEHNVKHYYLTVEYSRMSRLSGAIDFANSGIYAGLTFEY